MVQLVTEPGDGLGGQLGAHVPVEGARDPALLRVAQHVVTDREVTPTLLRVHPLDEVYVVVGVRFLVDNHEAPEHLAVVHLADQDVHVAGEVPDGL